MPIYNAPADLQESGDEIPAPDLAAIREARAATRAAMRAAIKKYAKPIKSPREIEQAKVTKWLKNRGLTETDLPSGFWEGEYDERERALYDLAREARERDADAKRQAWLIENGLPEDTDSLPWWKRDPLLRSARNRRYYAKKKATKEPKPPPKTGAVRAKECRERKKVTRCVTKT
jgi:hypothetical protein